jgi:hypothetical protein
MKIQAIATIRGFAKDKTLGSNEQRNLEITTYDDSPRLSVKVGEAIVNNVGIIGTAIRVVETREYGSLACKLPL